MNIIIHTDGSCSPNPGVGGWAAIIEYFWNKTKLEKETKMMCGGVQQTTNNRMELMAIIKALQRVLFHEHHELPIKVRTDSNYVKNGVTIFLHRWYKNGWKTRKGGDIKNQDLWVELYKLAHRQFKNKIEWEWVKGHNGDPLNEQVDRLAKRAREGFVSEDNLPVKKQQKIPCLE